MLFNSMTFQEFEDTYKIDPFYYDLASALITPYRVIYEYGPWIAGGFFARAIQGETLENYVGDIDVWFYTQEQVNEYIAGLDTNRFNLNAVKTENYKSDFSYSYMIPYKNRELKVQIISYKTFNNIDRLLERFDTYHSMIGTDGINVYYEKDLAIDCAKNKILNYNWEYLYRNQKFLPDSRMFLKRYNKFIANGYKITGFNLDRLAMFIKELPVKNYHVDDSNEYITV